MFALRTKFIHATFNIRLHQAARFASELIHFLRAELRRVRGNDLFSQIRISVERIPILVAPFFLSIARFGSEMLLSDAFHIPAIFDVRARSVNRAERLW